MWCTLLLLLSGTRAFLIHNVHHSLCLEETVATAEVVLKRCSLDSESQQWVWLDRSRLMSVASSRCLSSHDIRPVRTEACPEPEEEAKGLEWDCDRDRLIGRNTSMLLSLDGRRLTLSNGNKHSKWRSLDEGDICQEKLRTRRASEEFEVLEERAMTDEQKQYLRWFYRTEDPTYWTFALLALAFVCLLIGFMLLGMGAMANKNRKKIAKYKAAATALRKSDGEDLRVILHEDTSSSSSTPATPQAKPSALPPNGELSECKAGDIVLTYKDGNTSSLYPDAAAEPELTVEDEEAQGAEEEEISAAEPQPKQVVE